MIEPRRNFLLIQALRGLAAAWVVLFHIDKSGYVSGVTNQLPRWIAYAVFDYGSAGVAIFFVLSGFVINHSLTGRAMNGRAYLAFLLRRSVRLDPPYWAAILLTLAVAAIYARAKHQVFTLPSSSSWVAHILYLQELLHIREINTVFWTLTYEIQFYLVLSSGFCLITILTTRGINPDSAQLFVFVPLGALALLAAARAGDWAPHGLFANMWHGFFLGVLAYEAGVRGRWWPALVVLTAVTLVGAFETTSVFGIPCAATALVLWGAARTGYLDHGLGGAGWQFLGRISYSLYLVHVPLILFGFSIWGYAIGRGFARDLLGMLLVGSVIVLAATLFWWVIERPAQALSASVFRRRAAPRS